MKIISWNCQGLAKPKAIRALRFLLKETKPDIIFLCEVKTSLSLPISKALSSSLLTNQSFVPPVGIAGGLVLAWNSSVNIQINLQNSFLINALVHSDSNLPLWQFTGIYCPCHPIGKTSFWNQISDIAAIFDGPWLIMGDFNSIKSQSEKQGGRPFASSSNHNLFYELNNFGLIDLGFHGQPFTWNNKRSGLANVQQRIDRGVANSQWCVLFPRSSIFHLPAISSDHTPLILNSCISPDGRKPFRFEAMWTSDPTCSDVVNSSWNKPVIGSPPFQLHSRIKNVKVALKKWNSNHFGNCQSKIKVLKEQIECVQKKDKTTSNLALDENLQHELDIWLAREETLWRQKAKDKWLNDGDANTRYFHITTIIHSRTNKISSIKDLNNNLLFDRDQIGNCFLHFYGNLFKSDQNPADPPFLMDLNNLFTSIINDHDHINLTEIPSATLIKHTLFSFSSLKSPGPDGLPPLFFKSFWKTTKNALIVAVQHFFKTGHLLKALNSTFIALIPKTSKASRVDHYRPISLCNITYKTISKILANRLKVHLDQFISPYQMAFVCGRNINDNSIISHEIMSYLHKKKGSKGYMAIKVDLAKAFDRVE